MPTATTNFRRRDAAYVRALAEPAAATCRVNVYDGGYGFFMALDANADGRVSEREKRQAATSLANTRSRRQSRHCGRTSRCGISTSSSSAAATSCLDRANSLRRERRLPAAAAAGPDLVPAHGSQQRRRPDLERVPRAPRWVFDQLDTDDDELLDPQEAANGVPQADTISPMSRSSKVAC